MSKINKVIVNFNLFLKKHFGIASNGIFYVAPDLNKSNLNKDNLRKYNVGIFIGKDNPFYHDIIKYINETEPKRYIPQIDPDNPGVGKYVNLYDTVDKSGKTRYYIINKVTGKKQRVSKEKAKLLGFKVD